MQSFNGGHIYAITCSNEQILKLDWTLQCDYATLMEELKTWERRIDAEPSAPFTLCVTGNMFSFITTNTESKRGGEKLTDALLKVAMKVNSVIFCRVFPKQKVAAARRNEE